MSNNDVHGEVKLSGHFVVASGCFGTVVWNVCDNLYSILPREVRDELLEKAGERKINPYFNGLVTRLLAQAGCTDVAAESLEDMWSDEVQSVTCDFGHVEWNLSQGLWNALPEDQRENLTAIAVGMIHNFFGMELLRPLASYSLRKLHG